jgi:CHAD domain-containing protein
MRQKNPPADTPTGAARRELVEQLDKAIAGLARRALSDAAVHEIRKRLKRARAALRLLRECAGVTQYRHENSLIRDAARPLTPLRDAKVLLDTLRRRAPPERRPRSFTRRFEGVLREQSRAEQRKLRSREMEAAAQVLRAVRRRAAALSDEQLSRGPGAGLERTYKAGRKALQLARKRPTNEHLHEWRKQAKYLSNQLEIMRPFGLRACAKRCKQAKRLADFLGDDHDLALLTEQVFRHAKGGDAASQDDAVQDLIGSFGRRRKKLQRKAFRVGQKLYADAPKQYRYQP